MRKSALEAIEDAIDLKIARAALREYEKDPVSYTTEEVMEHLGLSNE